VVYQLAVGLYAKESLPNVVLQFIVHIIQESIIDAGQEHLLPGRAAADKSVFSWHCTK